VTLYLDTSSLVKLYVSEEGSDTVRKLVNAATVIATSVIAYAEARAAFARLRRERALTPPALASLKRGLDADWPSYVTLDVTEVICREAGDLAERFRLRSYDSVHLATFAQVVRRAGADTTRFSSYDVQLNEAVRKLTRQLRRVR
jgi:predicted nucleic acid-binding protein